MVSSPEMDQSTKQRTDRHEAAGIPQSRADAEDACLQKVYVEPTTDCNLSCAMCLRNTWDSPGGTMPVETFGRIVEQIEALPGVATINLSGFGEPMAHPRFYELVSRAKEAGLLVEVVTNGTLLDGSAAERLVDLELDRLVVSVDGITDSAHLGLHDASFAGVSANLRTLYHLRLSRRAARPDVTLQFVATRRNIHELPRLKALSRVLGFSGILVTNLVPATPALAGEVLYERPGTTSRPGRASPANPCVDLPLMDAAPPAGAVVRRLRRQGTYLRRNGVDVAGAGPRCRFVTEGRLAVRWDGSVSPCLPLLHSHTCYVRDKPKRIRSYHLGNVNDTPLEGIWRSAPYRAFRDRVRRFDFSPCIDCGGCDLRETNEEDCTDNVFPRCGECLWAAGLVQCP